MATKKPAKKRGASSAARRNKEVDDLDLAGQLDLPPAADTSLSPLAAARTESSPAQNSAAEPASQTEANADRASRPADEEASTPTRRRRSPRATNRATPDDDVVSAREHRDAERDRLVREALEARGENPDEIFKRAVPKGGKHRPTIELTPDEYAAISVANAVRPDLFDSTLVGFVRACARNWEKIAETLDDERGP